MRSIHPAACVDSRAELGDDVQIGPHCYVGPDVTIGDGCKLHHNVTVVGKTVLGNNNELLPGVVLGTPPQDLKYRGGLTSLVIGDDNVFREHVTAHPGTELGGAITRIGNHNRFLVATHVAHDVTVGSHCILANGVQIAGHCHIEDCVTIGGMVGLHHFCTIGKHSYVAGLTRVTVDAPPFMIFAGYAGRVRGVNVNGMSRWGFDQQSIDRLRWAYKLLFSRRAQAEGNNLLEKIAYIESNGQLDENLEYLLAFLKRSIIDGVYGRYRESLRRDTIDDRARFYRDYRHDRESP
ncbi:MAG: acyl-ACP--UDP-N-acetylglucosamine O-acyltransferase [Phycisphaerae bacterium]